MPVSHWIPISSKPKLIVNEEQNIIELPDKYEFFQAMEIQKGESNLSGNKNIAMFLIFMIH